MPRKATQKHPVRDLRNILGISQWRFAERIGINPGTLKRIENNDLNLTRRIARLIKFEAGVDDKQLLAGRLRNAGGSKYILSDYKAWKSHYFMQNEKIAEAEAMKLAAWIDILLRAAAKRSRLWQVSEALIEQLNDCRDAFGLRPLVENELKQQYKTQDPEFGIGWHAWFPQGRGDRVPELWWQRKYRSLERQFQRQSSTRLHTKAT